MLKITKDTVYAARKSEAGGRLPTVCPRRPCLCWGSSASLIVDLTFHAQWPTSQVQRQPPCIGHFACVEGNPS